MSIPNDIETHHTTGPDVKVYTGDIDYPNSGKPGTDAPVVHGRYDPYQPGQARLRRDALELAIKSGCFHDLGSRSDHYLLTRAASIASYLQDGTVPAMYIKPAEDAPPPHRD